MMNSYVRLWYEGPTSCLMYWGRQVVLWALSQGYLLFRWRGCETVGLCTERTIWGERQWGKSLKIQPKRKNVSNNSVGWEWGRGRGQQWEPEMKKHDWLSFQNEKVETFNSVFLSDHVLIWSSSCYTPSSFLDSSGTSLSTMLGYPLCAVCGLTSTVPLTKIK